MTRLYDANGEQITAADVLDGADLADHYAARNERLRATGAKSRRGIDPWAEVVDEVEREMQAVDAEHGRTA